MLNPLKCRPLHFLGFEWDLAPWVSFCSVYEFDRTINILVETILVKSANNLLVI